MGLSLVEQPTAEGRPTGAPAPRRHAALTTSPRPHQGRRLAALYETAARVATSLEVEKVLQTIVAHARDLLAADMSYITLVDRENQRVRMRVSTGTATPGFLDIVLPIGEGLGGAVARDARPTYTTDYLNDPAIRHDAAVDESVRDEGIRSILGVPLNGRSEVIGVLYVANRHVNTFDEADVELLATLGHHAALALENARLYEEAVASAEASAAARQLAEQHYRDLSLVHAVHERLTDALLAGEGVAGIATTLAATLSVSVTLTDASHLVLARAAPPGVTVDEVDRRGFLVDNLLARPEVRAAVGRATADFRATAVAGVDRLLCPIATKEDLLGFIWASMSPAGSSDALMTSLEQAARVVALELLRERAAEELEARQSRGFLDDLLGPDPPAAEALRHRARPFLEQVTTPHRPYVCHVARGAGSWSEATLAAAGIVRGCRPGEFVGTYRDRVAGFLQVTDAQRARTELSRVQGDLEAAGFEAGVVMGGVCEDFAEDRRTIREAEQLLDLIGPSPTGGVVALEQADILVTLFSDANSPRLDVLVDRALGPLLAMESRAGQDLMRTLQVYFQSVGNRAVAARRLGIHINTLYRRLERLDALLGPLDDPLRSVPLQVAALAWTIRAGRAVR